MDFSRLQELLDAYGAEPARWPADERATALALIQDSVEARRRFTAARMFDDVLDRHAPVAPPRFDAATLAARIAATPRPSRAPARAPGALWSISFAWPNFAGLAAAAIVGFVVGWTDPSNVASPGASPGNDLLAFLSSLEDVTW